MFYVLILAAWLAFIGLLLWLLTRVRYHVGEKYFKITLAGIPVRWLRLKNIKYFSTERPWFAEKWHNQLFPPHDCFLVIHKRRGLLKKLVITPRHRFKLKAELERARNALGKSRPVSRGDHPSAANGASAEPSEAPPRGVPFSK